MVYCGKPSKGCSNCRERKIRCDAREPGCGQCEKRQQLCPGYRNLVDLMFRDESSHVIKKAKAKARKKANMPVEQLLSPETTFAPSPVALVPEPPTKRLSLITPNTLMSPDNVLSLTWSTEENDDGLLPSPDSGSWPTTPGIALLYNLPPSSQERGTAWFFSRYVAIDETACHQRFDFVYDVWKPSTLVPERQVDGVLASMTAVGLLGLANMVRSQEMKEAARMAYGTALRLTNFALKNPAEAAKDTTMLAVLILGLFEMKTDTTPRTMKAWHEHVNGAAALAKMRGVKQFGTKAGVRMFLLLCQNVMISCIQQELPMPKALISLQEELMKRSDGEDPSWLLTKPTYRVLQIRYDMKKGNLVGADQILEQLDAVETEFEIHMASLPPLWRYRTLKLSRRHPAIFKGLCHVYSELCTATTLNSVRAMRMLVLETILSVIHTNVEALNPELVSDRDYLQVRKAIRKLRALSEAVIASVPQHLGLVHPNRPNDDMAPSPVSTPISSVEVRETSIPPTSPSTRSSASSSDDNSRLRKRHTGPTLADLTTARTPEDEAEQFMVLASATNTVVYPLYMVGLSSVCTDDARAYVVDRLRGIYRETAVSQASAVADLIEEHESSPEWMKFPERPHLPEDDDFSASTLI